MTVAYAIIFAISLILPVGFYLTKKQGGALMLVLNICVCVVNLGYLLLSISKTAEFALFANKIAYLRQIPLIMCMFLIVLQLCGFEQSRALTCTLGIIAALMYGLVLTTGHIGWYYESVELVFVDGAAKLVKEYGPLHPLHLIYVIGYFIAMLITIFHSLKIRQIASQKLAALMLAVVFSNIGMWLVEKMVSWNFEFLSVSYLMSEMVFLLVYWILGDYVHVSNIPAPRDDRTSVIFVDSPERQSRVESIVSRLPDGASLSPRQMDILEGILDGRSRKEIAADLHISENTVKMHTSSLYKALGVGGRDEIYAMLKNDKTTK